MAELRLDGHAIFRYGAVLAFLLCYTTILLGGNVMASDSGLGCPDWPTCHGTLLPALTGAQGVEYLHRIAAGLLSLAVFLLVPVAYRAERSRPVLQRMTYAAAGLVLAEALLGGVVVDSGLYLDFVLVHFFIATVLFGLLLLLAALSNLREVPRRWVQWAERAADGEPGPSAGPVSLPEGSDAPPAPVPARAAVPAEAGADATL